MQSKDEFARICLGDLFKGVEEDPSSLSVNETTDRGINREDRKSVGSFSPDLNKLKEAVFDSFDSNSEDNTISEQVKDQFAREAEEKVSHELLKILKGIR